MDVTALCPNCDEAVMLTDPEEGDGVTCPECDIELSVESIDLTSVPPKMLLEELDETDEDDEDEDTDEDDDEFDDEDDDETEV